MNPSMLINGKPGDNVSAHDRGLHYGDGLFETLAVRRDRPQLWDRHMERLRDGCRRLHFSPVDPSILRAEAEQLCAGWKRAVLKIVVTRGPGTRGYRIERAAAGTRIVSLSAAADYPIHYYRDGVAVRLCTTRLSCNPALAGIKHLNRLEQVLARAEWDDADIAEGLMCDARGHVIEGTMSNVFMVKDGDLITPRLTDCGVAGVMHGTIIEWAQANDLIVENRHLVPGEIECADEIFLCNSLIGIWPVRRIEEAILRPGPLTARITAAVGGYSLMPEAPDSDGEAQDHRTENRRAGPT